MSRWSLALTILWLVLLSGVSAAQSTWEEKNRAGEKAFQEGHLSEASHLFAEAQRDAQKFGPNDIRLAPIYNNQALIAFVENNFIASEILYERALAVLETQGSENPLLLPVLDNLTSLYVKEWAFGKAIQISWRACRIREKKFGPDKLETAASLDKLAKLYLDRVQLLPQSPSEKATLPASARSTPTARNSGSELRGVSTSSEDAVALDDKTSLETAESLFRRVLAVLEKAYGPENTRLVDVLQNLGEVLHAEGNLAAAEEAYSRTIAIVEKSAGPDDPRLALPLEQMAELATEAGNYAEAEKTYRRALRIQESGAGSTDPSLSALLTGYAGLLETMGRPEEAKTLADRARPLDAPRVVNTASVSPAASVPYILRFETSVYERYQGVQQTCLLIRADGRLRVEQQERQERANGSTSASVHRSPDALPDSSGTVQETLADNSGSGAGGPRVFESALDGDAIQQLRAILSAKEIRDIQGSYPSRAKDNFYGSERISASILRDDGVQNFAFPDTSARQPYEAGLKPLLKWLNAAEKRKGTALRGLTANNCSPDAPKAGPIPFISSKKPTVQNAETARVKAPAVAPSVSGAGPDTVATFKVRSNLVLVRAVVRDAQGRVLGTLRQEDFRLLENGKPQTITAFSVQQVALGASTEQRPSNGPPNVERSVVYLFDDINLNAADLNQLRSAADSHLSSLQPGVRAAVLTTSGRTELDFTDDRAKLREALTRIQPYPVANSAGNDCPEIDAYMADLIWNQHDEDALGAATEDALVCAYGNDRRFGAAAEGMAKATAQQRVASARAQGQMILRAFQTALRRLSAARGQRALILVSPGFVAPGNEREFGQLIDDAIHSDIVISALDARGLYQIDSVGRRTTVNLQYRQESASANEDILAAFANATGGTWFHNSNDFATGFGRMSETPEYSYVLAFSPRDEELDGRFHKLTVALNNGEKLTVQARKGYYARKQ